MAGERSLTVELDDGSKLVVVAEQVGPALVADTDVLAKLSGVTSSIERVSRDILDAVRRAYPTKATVELGFGLAIEAGQLVALFGKGKGEATIKLTLEWTRSEADRPAPDGSAPGGSAPGGSAPGGSAPGGSAPGGSAQPPQDATAEAAPAEGTATGQA